MFYKPDGTVDVDMDPAYEDASHLQPSRQSVRHALGLCVALGNAS